MTTLIIVGLGNPGPQYERTRHNIGFLALDHIREKFSASDFQVETTFFAEISTVVLNGNKVILAKPTTSMNVSGRAVQAILNYYTLGSESLIVIHDDLDIAPGTLRVTTSSRAAGHNGVQDIIDTLGTQDFMRLRLGIGRPTEVEGVCMPSHDYVLGRFSTEETQCFPELFETVVTYIHERLGIR